MDTACGTFHLLIFNFPPSSMVAANAGFLLANCTRYIQRAGQLTSVRKGSHLDFWYDAECTVYLLGVINLCHCYFYCVMNAFN